MHDQKKYKFNVDVENIRLDKFLAEKLSDFSRTSIQYSIKSNLVTINNKPVKASVKINIGDVIECAFENKQKNDTILPQDIPLDILFEDDHIIVINKPSGLVVHPGNGNKDGTLANALAYHYSRLSDISESRPGIIHRLDKDTSGVMIVAKTNNAHIKISNQFSNKEIKKIYYALAWGSIPDKGIIEGLIKRDSFNRTKFKMSDRSGKSSKTKYSVEKYFEPISIVKLEPETGRTHQLRVHLSSIGHPIFSDNQYSGGKSRTKSYHVKYTSILKRLFKCIDRVALHAESIEFIHPFNKKKVSFSASFPEDFLKAMRLLESQ